MRAAGLQLPRDMAAQVLAVLRGAGEGGPALMEDIHALVAGMRDLLRSDPRLADVLGELLQGAAL